MSDKNQACIYLIPTFLGDSSVENVMPPMHSILINELTCFIVEDLRSARRFLKRIGYKNDFENTSFFELNEHTQIQDVEHYLSPLMQGVSIGLMSEAGCPGVADPGAEIINLAHHHNIRVVPLVGPSSILLALMASGFNGQNFAFNGYLPIDKPKRIRSLKQLEEKIYKEHQTQIFIEAPYRNNHLFQDILKTCNPQTKLCVACDITLSSEYIVSKTVSSWSSVKLDLNKRPTVFLLYQ